MGLSRTDEGYGKCLVCHCALYADERGCCQDCRGVQENIRRVGGNGHGPELPVEAQLQHEIRITYHQLRVQLDLARDLDYHARRASQGGKRGL